MRELALFAGAGGGILGGVLLGWRTVCAVEINAYCARRLMQRQNEGHLPPFPVWDDVCTFDGRRWRGFVDVVSGGFPCQDISAANSKGAGINGEKSGLWREFARIVREVQPRYAFVENSPALVVRGLGTVLGDLAEMGMDAGWGVLGAIHVGAPHSRERIWIAAYSNSEGTVAHPSKPRLQGETWEGMPGTRRASIQPACGGWWSTEPGMGRVAHGVANRMDRIRSLGNGQVPAVVAGAWEALRPPITSICNERPRGREEKENE
jgi:DNA (cytosine-5)-methyltransferase 1